MKLHQSLDDASKGEDVVRDVLDVSDAAARIRTWEPLRDETLNLAPFPCLATATNSGKPPPGKKKFPHERRQSFGHETSYRNGGIRNIHIRIELATATPARIKRRMIAKS